MTQFTEEVLVIIQRIPCGRVMSYGQVARLAGNTRGAAIQRELLISEGVEVSEDGYIDISAYGI